MSQIKNDFTIGALREYLSRIDTDKDDLPVQILLALPSVGSRASTDVTGASMGFDWDRGLYLTPKERLVPKTKKQDLYEQAQDLMMFLATEGLTKKKKRYENRTAEKIILRNGTTPEQLKSYVKLFHIDKEIVNVLECEKDKNEND